MERLNELGFTILVETNGTQPLRDVPSKVHLIADIKLPGSGHQDSFLVENLTWLKIGHDELKFVITDRNDFAYAIDFIRQHDLYQHILLFAPVWEKLSPAILAKWITELSYPVRLNLQLHKVIWDKDLRGV
jgi:7-carboxy-7-deazaguanine synthase